jgi:hypothetical protein
MAVATTHELPKFLRPLWTWIEATPVHVLVVLFIGLITLAIFEVCPLLNPSVAPRIAMLTCLLALCHSASRRAKASPRPPRREAVHYKPSHYRTNTASTSAMLV